MFTREQTLSVLAQIVDDPSLPGRNEAAPGGVGGVCFYRHPDGAPSCLIGHLLARLAPEALAALDEGANYWSIGRVESLLQLFEPAAADLLVPLQRSTDRGTAWKEAFKPYRPKGA